jgi:DNA-binding beta-propeller fold protein YncE
MNWMPVFSRDARGNVAPARKLATVTSAFGIVADEEQQEIFISVQRDHAVAVFKKTAKDRDAAVRNVQGPHTLLADPHGLTLDTKTGLLYVTNWGSTNDRDTPAEGNGPRNLPIGRDNSIPGSGRFGPPSITVYPKAAKGDVPPVQVIQGPKTQLNWPTALAVHPDRGELFVANDSGDTVTVFRADATGDAAPIRVLKGPRTMIKNPTGVAVDVKNNELWVANFGTHAATVYKIDAEGDVAPIRMIRSGPLNAPTSMIGNPHTMAFDTKRDELLVAN